METPRTLSPQLKLAITLGLIVVLVGLGTADYFLSNQTAQLTGDTVPEGAVAKNAGPKVEDVIEASNLTSTTSNDLSLIAQIVTDGTAVQSLAILENGDRAGSVTWVESPKVKDYFMALKDALLEAFSPQMRDLKDETVQEENKPVRNILTFLDPTLSAERIVFVRVRERLYEFHVAEGKDDTMNAFIEEVTTR